MQSVWKNRPYQSPTVYGNAGASSWITSFCSVNRTHLKHTWAQLKHSPTELLVITRAEAQKTFRLLTDFWRAMFTLWPTLIAFLLQGMMLFELIPFGSRPCIHLSSYLFGKPTCKNGQPLTYHEPQSFILIVWKLTIFWNFSRSVLLLLCAADNTETAELCNILLEKNLHICFEIKVLNLQFGIINSNLFRYDTHGELCLLYLNSIQYLFIFGWILEAQIVKCTA